MTCTRCLRFAVNILLVPPAGSVALTRLNHVTLQDHQESKKYMSQSSKEFVVCADWWICSRSANDSLALAANAQASHLKDRQNGKEIFLALAFYWWWNKPCILVKLHVNSSRWWSAIMKVKVRTRHRQTESYCRKVGGALHHQWASDTDHFKHKDHQILQDW